MPNSKYLVTWDFPKKPAGTFWRVVLDEFGTSHAGGDYWLIQKSVALCRDDFTASRLAALAEWFGAQVAAFSVADEGLPAESQHSAAEYVARVLKQRIQRRGKRR